MRIVLVCFFLIFLKQKPPCAGKDDPITRENLATDMTYQGGFNPYRLFGNIPLPPAGRHRSGLFSGCFMCAGVDPKLHESVLVHVKVASFLRTNLIKVLGYILHRSQMELGTAYYTSLYFIWTVLKLNHADVLALVTVLKDVQFSNPNDQFERLFAAMELHLPAYLTCSATHWREGIARGEIDMDRILIPYGDDTLVVNLLDGISPEEIARAAQVAPVTDGGRNALERKIVLNFNRNVLGLVRYFGSLKQRAVAPFVVAALLQFFPRTLTQPDLEESIQVITQHLYEKEPRSWRRLRVSRGAASDPYRLVSFFLNVLAKDGSSPEVIRDASRTVLRNLKGRSPTAVNPHYSSFARLVRPDRVEVYRMLDYVTKGAYPLEIVLAAARVKHYFAQSIVRYFGLMNGFNPYLYSSAMEVLIALLDRVVRRQPDLPPEVLDSVGSLYSYLIFKSRYVNMPVVFPTDMAHLNVLILGLKAPDIARPVRTALNMIVEVLESEPGKYADILRRKVPVHQCPTPVICALNLFKVLRDEKMIGREVEEVVDELIVCDCYHGNCLVETNRTVFESDIFPERLRWEIVQNVTRLTYLADEESDVSWDTTEAAQITSETNQTTPHTTIRVEIASEKTPRVSETPTETFEESETSSKPTEEIPVTSERIPTSVDSEIASETNRTSKASRPSKNVGRTSVSSEASSQRVSKVTEPTETVPTASERVPSAPHSTISGQIASEKTSSTSMDNSDGTVSPHKESEMTSEPTEAVPITSEDIAITTGSGIGSEETNRTPKAPTPTENAEQISLSSQKVSKKTEPTETVPAASERIPTTPPMTSSVQIASEKIPPTSTENFVATVTAEGGSETTSEPTEAVPITSEDISMTNSTEIPSEEKIRTPEVPTPSEYGDRTSSSSKGGTQKESEATEPTETVSVTSERIPTSVSSEVASEEMNGTPEVPTPTENGDRTSLSSDVSSQKDSDVTGPTETVPTGSEWGPTTPKMTTGIEISTEETYFTSTNQEEWEMSTEPTEYVPITPEQIPTSFEMSSEVTPLSPAWMEDDDRMTLIPEKEAEATEPTATAPVTSERIPKDLPTPATAGTSIEETTQQRSSKVPTIPTVNSDGTPSTSEATSPTTPGTPDTPSPVTTIPPILTSTVGPDMNDEALILEIEHEVQNYVHVNLTAEQRLVTEMVTVLKSEEFLRFVRNEQKHHLVYISLYLASLKHLEAMGMEAKLSFAQYTRALIKKARLMEEKIRHIEIEKPPEEPVLFKLMIALPTPSDEEEMDHYRTLKRVLHRQEMFRYIKDKLKAQDMINVGTLLRAILREEIRLIDRLSVAELAAIEFYSNKVNLKGFGETRIEYGVRIEVLTQDFDISQIMDDAIGFESLDVDQKRRFNRIIERMGRSGAIFSTWSRWVFYPTAAEFTQGLFEHILRMPGVDLELKRDVAAMSKLIKFDGRGEKHVFN